MTDRELLELAAKAAGLDLEWFGPWACMARNLGVIDGFDRHTCWAPLTDDGDALRLAATLCFSVIQYKHSVEIMIGDDLIHRELSDGTMTRIELNRRAITRAAAEIGKAMP